jgi:hypothetical protein
MLVDNISDSATACIIGMEEEQMNTAAEVVKGEIELQRQLDGQRW